MTLKELLRLIETDDDFLVECSENVLDCRPNSVFKVLICPMCEEETWVTFSTRSALLVPWYHCRVSAIEPYDEITIQVWLADYEFLVNNFKEDINLGTTESDAGNGD